MPPSLIGSRADLLIEIVVLLTVAALPAMALAIRAAAVGRHATHRWIQLSLAATFLIATVALEVDIRLAGGMEAFVSGGAWEGSRTLEVVLYGHLLVAAINAVLWIAVPIWSSRCWRRSLPGPGSARHRQLGWLSALSCAATSVSGVVLYVLGFVL